VAQTGAIELFEDELLHRFGARRGSSAE
jgi:hypothetical protein